MAHDRLTLTFERMYIVKEEKSKFETLTEPEVESPKQRKNLKTAAESNNLAPEVVTDEKKENNLKKNKSN